LELGVGLKRAGKEGSTHPVSERGGDAGLVLEGHARNTAGAGELGGGGHKGLGAHEGGDSEESGGLLLGGEDEGKEGGGRGIYDN